MSRPQLPGHKWQYNEETRVVDNVTYFVYRCSKCPAVTLSGEPLVPPYNAKCG